MWSSTQDRSPEFQASYPFSTSWTSSSDISLSLELSIPVLAALGLPGADLKGDWHQLQTKARDVDGMDSVRRCPRGPARAGPVGRQPGHAQGRRRPAISRPGDQQ